MLLLILWLYIQYAICISTLCYIISRLKVTVIVPWYNIGCHLQLFAKVSQWVHWLEWVFIVDARGLVHWLMIHSAVILTQCAVAQLTYLGSVLSYSKCQAKLRTLCCCLIYVVQTLWSKLMITAGSHEFYLRDNDNKQFGCGHSCL